MIRVEALPWERHADALLSIRLRVFVDEQGVPPELEPDDQDPRCWHVAAAWRPGSDPDQGGGPAQSTTGTPDWVGTARMTPEGRIGRMAVLAGWRGRGLGGAMLRQLLDIAVDQSLPEVTLLAQLHALRFYQSHGFRAHGPEIEEAGIPHRAMSLTLKGRGD